MGVSNVAAAASLQRVGGLLEAAATRMDEALALDQTIRFRPWRWRPNVHDDLRLAVEELRRAEAAFPADFGFTAARSAVKSLGARTRPKAIGELGPASNLDLHRRETIESYRDRARTWASVVRAGARLLADPTTTPASIRAAALDGAHAVARDPWRPAAPPRDDLVLLAALDQLPPSLRPNLPDSVAGSAIRTITGEAFPQDADQLLMLGSWEQRVRMVERPGFDRLAAVAELERAVDMRDPQEALRVVAAIDQLPGHVRPDLPHVTVDWNWTSAQELREPGHHAFVIARLRSRLEDIRAAATLGSAPTRTVDEVARVVGRAGDTVHLDDLRALRDLPGFPPSLVPYIDARSANFDVVRARVWVDTQRLAARPRATREDMVAELQRALDGLRPDSERMRGGAGSGADLADHLERPGHSLPRPHDALVRIAAIDALPAALRPDMPDLIGVGSRLDAAAHVSPQSADHRRDMLRLQAWATKYPRREPVASFDGMRTSDAATRSALRRFLDPFKGEAGSRLPSRDEQASVLGDVLSSAGSLEPRLHHGALGAAVRFLEASPVVDSQVRALADRTLTQVRRNMAYTEGVGNPGYRYHPNYADLGGIAESIRLIRSFERLDAKPVAETLSW